MIVLLYQFEYPSTRRELKFVAIPSVLVSVSDLVNMYALCLHGAVAASLLVPFYFYYAGHTFLLFLVALIGAFVIAVTNWPAPRDQSLTSMDQVKSYPRPHRWIRVACPRQELSFEEGDDETRLPPYNHDGVAVSHRWYRCAKMRSPLSPVPIAAPYHRKWLAHLLTSICLQPHPVPSGGLGTTCFA